MDVEKAFAYLKPHPFVGLDPALAVRLEEATALRSQWNQKKGEYADPDSALLAELQARAVNGDVLLMAQGLKDPLSEALGFPLKVSKPYPKTSWGSAAPFKTEGLSRSCRKREARPCHPYRGDGHGLRSG